MRGTVVCRLNSPTDTFVAAHYEDGTSRYWPEYDHLSAAQIRLILATLTKRT